MVSTSITEFTEEQQRIRQYVWSFARKEIAPFVETMERQDQFPSSIIQKMGEHGLMGLPIEPRWGGAGADFVSYILAIQEISKVSATIGVILSVHTSVGTNPILYFGTEAQKTHFLPKLTAGKYLGAFALTEPSSGSHAASIRTTAVRNGDHFILNGSKIFITNAGVADLYITFAVTNSAKGTHGISAFIVEKDTPGFIIGKKAKKMGLHGSNTSELFFENAVVPVRHLLGQEGDGFKIAMANLDRGRIGIAAQSIGIAEAAYEYALSIAKIKQQYTAIGSLSQVVAFKLADMATELEAAKLLVYRAAGYCSEGLPCAIEASMSKRFASDLAMKITVEAMEIAGELSMSKDYPLERYFRDAKVTQIYEGTNEIQRLVIAKHLLQS